MPATFSASRSCRPRRLASHKRAGRSDSPGAHLGWRGGLLVATNLALGELGASREVLAALLAEGETLFVEHKSGIESGDGFQIAKAAASFANTLGGWILAGVDPKGNPVPN